MRDYIAFAAVLLGSAACSAQALPQNAPLDPALKNIPATTGRANLPRTEPPFAIQTIGQFKAPFAMAFLQGGALLVTEKAGQLKLRDADGTVADVRGVPAVAVGGQGGLLDVAVATPFSVGPDGVSGHTVYLTYAEPGDSGSQLALARGALKITKVVCVKAPCPPQAVLENVRVLWRSGSIGPGGQFGATIAFAPDGKSLFLSSGERQRFTPAQDPEQALGKIVHLTLDGAPAPGNPMLSAGGVRAATWTSGHRNPYGLVFDAQGRLWENEMGPKGGDELNLILPGKNYGWPIVSNGDNYSGQPIPDHPSRPDLEAPKLWWNPSISPGGMMIYSGAMFPQYRGSAFIAALSDQSLIRVTLGDAPAKADQWAMGLRVRDVAQAPDGAIWVLEDGQKGGGGKLLRLTPRK
jgi:glucose/arabinose dehydrogenase